MFGNKKIKLMVVEDEELLLEVITKKLQESGIEVVGCKSGEEALTELGKTKVLPNAIWLDYHLKGMDGLQFIVNMKLTPEFAQIPIVVVSNSANDETVQKLLTAGANKYLLKAQNRLEDIVNIIKNLFD